MHVFSINRVRNAYEKVCGANGSDLRVLSELCNDGSAGDGRKTQIGGWCWLHGIPYGLGRESVEARTRGR